MKHKTSLSLKNNWYKFVIADASFFALLGFVLYYARKKITAYILMLQSYAGEISSLSQQVAEQGIDMIDKVEALSNVISPTMGRLKLMIYIFVPLGLFLVWCITQFVFYNVLSGKKVFDWKAKTKFFLVNVPLFALLLLMIDLLLRQFTVDIAIMVILMYFAQVFFSLMHDFTLAKAFKKSLVVSLKKIYLFFPLAILNIVLFIFAFIFLWDILIKIVSGTGSYLLSVALLIIFSLAWTFYKVFLINFIRSKSL
ncbi:MAG: hypothetical protein V1906_01425 [Candidatus Woesearchaeota archaeon]